MGGPLYVATFASGQTTKSGPPRLFRAVARTCALLGYLGPQPWKHDCLHMALERRKE
jgi:hypothetical protein